MSLLPISSPKARSRAGASAASGVMYWSHGIGNGQPDLAILSMLMNMNNDPIEVYQLRCEGSLGYRLSGTLPKGEFDYQIGQYIDMGVGKFRIQGIEHHQGKCRIYGTFVSEDEMLLTMFLPAYRTKKQENVPGRGIPLRVGTSPPGGTSGARLAGHGLRKPAIGQNLVKRPWHLCRKETKRNACFFFRAIPSGFPDIRPKL